MIELIIGALIGGCFFIVPLWAYRRGLKDGLAISNNRTIEPIKTPMQVIREEVQRTEDKKDTDQFIQGLNNLLSYDGVPQKEE